MVNRAKSDTGRTCSRLMTASRVLMYGNACDVVMTVLRLYCSCSSPWARPSTVNGVSYINRSETHAANFNYHRRETWNHHKMRIKYLYWSETYINNKCKNIFQKKQTVQCHDMYIKDYCKQITRVLNIIQQQQQPQNRFTAITQVNLC